MADQTFREDSGLGVEPVTDFGSHTTKPPFAGGFFSFGYRVNSSSARYYPV